MSPAAVRIDGLPTRIVGVLPRDFRLPLEFQSRGPAQVIQPLGLDRSAPDLGGRVYYGIGRLKPGVTGAAVTRGLEFARAASAARPAAPSACRL